VAESVVEEEAEEEEEEDSPQTRALVQRQSAAATSSAKEAFEKVQRLEQELAQCVQELRSVDANASEAVARHPAFRRMRAAVVEKLETLHAELVEARSAYEKQVTQQRALMAPEVDEDEDEDEEQHDLSPMLRAALDKLWQRPYDCRIFTLQLLQSLAQLDDQSLCMMTSCFARYLDNHSEPA
jgi:chromosome segregation ATPase